MSYAANPALQHEMDDNESGEMIFKSSASTNSYNNQQPLAKPVPLVAKSAAVNGGGGGNHPILLPPKSRSELQQDFAFEWEVDSQGCYGAMLSCLGTIVGTIGMIPGCCCFPSKYQRVEQGYVGLVTKFGQLYKSSDPGLVEVIPLTDKLISVNVMLQTLNTVANNCLTRDNVSVDVSSVLYFQIVEPHTTAFKVRALTDTLVERTKTTLRQVIGSRNLQDVIEKREEIAELIENIINAPALSWGVKVESLLIKGIEVPTNVSNSLSMAAEAKRIGESKIIKAKAEVESAKLMRKAADILASKPAMQIRYLDAMQSMAATANSKVIFMPSQSSIEQAAKLGAGPGAPGNDGEDDGRYMSAITESGELTEGELSKMAAMQEVMK